LDAGGHAVVVLGVFVRAGGRGAGRGAGRAHRADAAALVLRRVPVSGRLARGAATAAAEAAEEAEEAEEGASKNNLLHEGNLQVVVKPFVATRARPVLPRPRAPRRSQGRCPAMGRAVALTALRSGRSARSEPSGAGLLGRLVCVNFTRRAARP